MLFDVNLLMTIASFTYDNRERLISKDEVRRRQPKLHGYIKELRSFFKLCHSFLSILCTSKEHG